MINSSCRKTEQSDIRKSQSSPGIASTLLPRTSSNTPELCQLSRRKAMLSGTAVVWMAITAPARAQANLEVLRALERRQQSLEPLRRGVRGLDELQGQLVVLGKLVDEALLAVEQNDDAPVASVFQGLQGKREYKVLLGCCDVTPRASLTLLCTAWEEGELEDARSLPRELAVMLRCVRPSFDR